MPRQSVAAVAQKAGLAAGEDPYHSVKVAELGLADLLESFNAQTAFTGRPSENFSYSNDSFALLSEIVRLYGGEATFAQYVEKNILSPLEMTDSGVRLMWQGDHVSKLYQMRDGEMADDWTMLDDQGPHAGAGGLKSTLNEDRKSVV